ncbi:hypothetical protein XI09_22030 [Bradyrhizobium sp. CCBAU 11386]|uniref:hypothetical protein n=1 Tax=Bradyrhizobium sp. CCBAU 11386 TaxID=1630837 RepID=UPI002302C035|nr:hypothetical protein [Bradyrhizobium sp. CCBAU 11386]MDA9507258.1 hypothetical protein [Bradyrhizobium sp. CCBAU 11386]
MPADLERAVASFSVRSSKRDTAIDGARIALLEESIDTVIRGLIAERTGLVGRVKQLLDEPEALAKWSSTTEMQPSKSEFECVEKRLRLLDRQLSECRLIERAVANLRILTGGMRPTAGV